MTVVLEVSLNLNFRLYRSVASIQVYMLLSFSPDLVRNEELILFFSLLTLNTVKNQTFSTENNIQLKGIFFINFLPFL